MEKPILVSPPQYTELEKQRMRERFDRFSPKLQREVLLKMEEKDRRAICRMMGIEVPIEEPKHEIKPLTYKQLAQNFKGQVQVKNKIRKVIRGANKEKMNVRLVNKPGSVITTPEGKFMITSKGKSIRIGD